VAYEYVVAGYLGLALIAFVLQPSGKRFALLCALAGFAPFVRPTAVCYSLTAFVIGYLAARPVVSAKARWAGFVVGVTSAAALLTTNTIRFGAPLEFGHSIHTNIYTLIDYTTVFENPFGHAPFFAAVKDLIGSLLYTNIPGWKGFYDPEIFRGQSEVFRWHEFYFRVFDGSFLILVLLAAVVGITSWQRSAPRPLDASGRAIFTLLAWGAGSFLLLFGFYLKTPGISSRFLADFAPAFAAIFVGVMLLADWRLRQRPRWIEQIVLNGLLVVGLAWYGIEFALQLEPETRLASKAPKAISSADVADVLTTRDRPSKVPPRYLRGDADDSNIPFNILGWDNATGATSPYMVFFVENPKQVRLVFAPDPAIPRAAFAEVGVKVGLETLRQASETDEQGGHAITFARPERPTYQTGVQMLSVKTVAATRLRDAPLSGLTLLEVSWKN